MAFSAMAFIVSTPLPTRAPVLQRISTRPRRWRVARVHAVRAVAGVVGTDVTAADAGLDSLLEPRDVRRYIFFGGKGGVGKTSSAAAAAVKMADEGLVTLVISTDPAHSLGDALRVELSGGGVVKVSEGLYAVESDTRDAVEEFRELVAALSEGRGEEGWKGVANKLGLSEFGDILETIPPGADELIALVRVLNLVEKGDAGISFDRIVIDTAPTGHTLRLLAFPDFLDSFLTQALALRRKLDSASGMVGNVTKMFLGGAAAQIDVNSALEVASVRVAAYRDRMMELSELFRDPARAEFVVVSIATVLAVEESKRLIAKLWDEGIWVRHVVANQVLPEGDDDMLNKYLKQLRKGQAREISFAAEEIADEHGLAISTVPRFDTEVRGVYGLRALGTLAFAGSRCDNYGVLMRADAGVASGRESQFVFVGGKGGVGKTSISAAMGVTLADRGLKTLVLSTDPAHSLADALGVGLDGGAPVPIEATNGNLYAMEIDTAGAVAEFQALVQDFTADGRRGVGADIARKLGLDEFAALLNNAPPGIDELVALTQVMDLVKYGDFDRVVIDTAPTGHTLRLLSFPAFLDNFLGKLVRLKQRLDSTIDTLRSVLGRKGTADAVDKAAKGVARFRQNMLELSDLIGDETRTQFVIVTVPTGLAMAESERLIKALKKDGVLTRNLIINQVITDDSAASFVGRIVGGQERCLEELEQAGADKNIKITRVPFFDVEVRGLYGLRAMAANMFRS